LNPEESTGALLYGHYYALCCQKDSERVWNHQTWVFDLNTIQNINGEAFGDQSFATCECWRWNVDAQYFLQRNSGAIIAVDNNTKKIWEYSLGNIYDEPVSGGEDSSLFIPIVAKWQTAYRTGGLFTRSRPIKMRIKGEQSGSLVITPYFIGNFSSKGQDGTDIPLLGTVAIAGEAISGSAQVSQVKQHIEAIFSICQGDECFSLYFEKGGIDPFFKLSGYELFYITSEAVFSGTGKNEPVSCDFSWDQGGLIAFHVTYDGNGNTGGTPPIDPNAYLDGQTAVVLDNTGSLVKTGSSFLGWCIDAGGFGVTIPPGSNATINVDLTLYAKWSPAEVPDGSLLFKESTGEQLFKDSTGEMLFLETTV
jgi:hypothetical protein